MPIRKPWFVTLIVGISMALAIWTLALFVRGDWLSDTLGAPFSIIVVSGWFVTLSLGWAIIRLVTATTTPLFVRSLHVVAASLWAGAMLVIAHNLIALSHDQPTDPRWSSGLLFAGAILSSIATIAETSWGKHDVRAWIRTMGAAVLGALLLIGLIVVWFTR